MFAAWEPHGTGELLQLRQGWRGGPGLRSAQGRVGAAAGMDGDVRGARAALGWHCVGRVGPCRHAGVAAALGKGCAVRRHRVDGEKGNLVGQGWGGCAAGAGGTVFSSVPW